MWLFIDHRRPNPFDFELKESRFCSLLPSHACFTEAGMRKLLRLLTAYIYLPTKSQKRKQQTRTRLGMKLSSRVLREWRWIATERRLQPVGTPDRVRYGPL